MKRFSIALTLLAMLVLAACSPVNQEAAALAGDWEGDLIIAGAPVPVSFSVNGQGEIDDRTFSATFMGEEFSYQVEMEVINSRIWIDAYAELEDVAWVSFTLTGLIEEEVISGDYAVEFEWYTGGAGRVEETGTFTIERVHQ